MTNDVYKEIIRKKNSPYFIAEIGINHNGNFDLAKKMILAAKESGADCVKFQSLKASKYISSLAQKAPYQINETKFKTKSQLEIIKECEIKIYEIEKLKKFCKKIKIDFLSTPFEIFSLRELIKLGEKTIKVSSCNLTNIPFMKEISKYKVNVLLSTGMSKLDEVLESYNILKQKNLNVGIFQCTSNYPCKFENSNLNVINTYKEIFGRPIGFSDHTFGTLPAIVAGSIGVDMIEKHFTLSRSLPGVDQKASIEPKELKKLINDLKKIKKIKGSKHKKVVKEEIDTKLSLRRSLVANKNLFKGNYIKKNDIAIKRPGTGIEPKFFEYVIGKKIKKNIKKDEILNKESFKL